MFRVGFKYLLMALLSAAGVAVYAFSPGENLQLANQLYQEGKYDSAAVQYEAILSENMVAPEVYYNLGNCYYKMKDNTSAILNYERALRLAPNDDDIAFNLQLAYYQTIDKVEVMPKLFIWRWWDNLRNLFSFDGWAYLGIALLLLAIGFFTVFKISRDAGFRKVMFYPGLITAVLTIFALLAAEHQYTLNQQGKEAIIFTPTLTLKSSPDEGGKDLVVVHEGLKVYILDNLGAWSKVKLSNGTVGWVKNSSYVII